MPNISHPLPRVYDNAFSCYRVQLRDSNELLIDAADLWDMIAAGRTGKWAAKIRVNDRLITIGRFTLESDAARAYDRAAKEHFGEFARTNADLGLL